MATGTALGRPEFKLVNTATRLRQLSTVVRHCLIFTIEDRDQPSDSRFRAGNFQAFIPDKANETVLIGRQRFRERYRHVLFARRDRHLDFFQHKIRSEVLRFGAGPQLYRQAIFRRRSDAAAHGIAHALFHRQPLRCGHSQGSPRTVGRQLFQHQFTGRFQRRAAEQIIGRYRRHLGNKMSHGIEPAMQHRQRFCFEQFRRLPPAFQTQRHRLSDRLPTVCAGTHDACGTERDMTRADNPSRKKKVIDVLADHASQRNLVDAFGMKLAARRFIAVNAVSGMVVNRPAAVRDRIGKRPLLHHILLSHHVEAFEAAALALARYRSDPLQRQVLHAIKVAAVLDVVPHAVDNFPEFPLDFLGVFDRVAVATVFQPPETRPDIVPTNAFDAIQRHFVNTGKRRRLKIHRAAHILAVKVNGMAQQLRVRFLRSQFFTELLARLGADPESGPCLKRHETVTRRVAKILPLNVVSGRILRTKCLHGGNMARAVFYRVVHGGVQQQCNIAFRTNFVEQHGIENNGIAFRVSIQVFQQQLIDDASFTGPAIVITHVRSGAQAPEANFAGGIASQHGPILNQAHRFSRPRRRDGRAATGQPTTDNHQLCVNALDGILAPLGQSIV